MHTFSYGNVADHVFRYRDLAGNEGTTTVKCPVVIDKKPILTDDKTPPLFTFAVNSITNGVRSSVGSFGEGFAASELPAFNQTLELVFDITDENAVTLTCSGAEVSGTTVRIKANGSFNVKLVDTAGNTTNVPLNITTFDNTPPSGTVSYSVLSGDAYGVRAVLTITEENVQILNDTGVKQLTEEKDGIQVAIKGKYYHDFAINESFTFRMQDAAGNIGNVIASCTTLDFSPPSSRLLWTPGRDQDANGNNQLITGPTNSDIKLFVKFSKPVKNVFLTTDAEGTTPYTDSKVKLTANSKDAALTFTQNDTVWLQYTGTNNISGAQEFKVDVIDKTTATITSTQASAPDKSYETVTFTSDKVVTFVDGTPDKSAKLPSGTSFTKKFTENGDYTMRFADNAGNTATKAVIISSIDRTPPKLTIKGKPLTVEAIKNATPEEKAEYEQINGKGSFKRVMTNKAIVMKVKINEDGTILWNGKEYPVLANAEQEITIEGNGAYNLVARDKAGLATTARIFVDSIDNIAPNVRFSRSELSLPVGTSVADATAAAKANLHYSDNVTAEDKLTVSYTLPTVEDMKAEGTYPVTATVTDAVGNIATATCTLYIYPKDRPTLLINGSPVKEGGTAFISEKQLTATVSNLTSGNSGTEPYKLYCKKGINTIGQMKDAPIVTGAIPLDTDSFYTIYLMTQSKKEAIVYVYVQY